MSRLSFKVVPAFHLPPFKAHTIVPPLGIEYPQTILDVIIYENAELITIVDLCVPPMYSHVGLYIWPTPVSTLLITANL